MQYFHGRILLGTIYTILQCKSDINTLTRVTKEHGDASNALLYAANACSLSSQMNSDFQHCKSLLLLAEIERLLGHPEASLKILCRNLPKICRIDDNILYGKAMLAISNSLIDLYLPGTPAKFGGCGTATKQVLEMTSGLLRESISSFSKMLEVSLLNDSLVMYLKVVSYLKLRDDAERIEKNLLSLHVFRRNKRNPNRKNTGEILDVISRLFLSKNIAICDNYPQDRDVSTLLQKLGRDDIMAISYI